MGRQINYYMDEETEQIFFEYLVGDCTIYQNTRTEVFEIKELPEKFSDGWSQLYLHKKELGDFIVKTYDNGIKSVDVLRSYAVEYDRCLVDFKKKTVSRGRIYLVTQYWGEDGELIKKSAELGKWYNSLVRWIKKNVPYQEYHYRYTSGDGTLHEGTDKAYFSDSLRPLIDR